MNKKELWLKLKAYHFDHLVPSHLWDYVTENFDGVNASTKAFASKIARKCGWPKKFALKAITEYKKFVYLGIVSDFSVTPSKIIDQVWHEHLLFTKAYRAFCNDVIQYEFDHSPELVPMIDQTGTFNAQYLETIALYKTEFGIDPPFNIWAVPKFDKQAAPANGYESTKKKKTFEPGDSAMYYSDGPLCSYFDSSEQSLNSEFSGFEGGDGGGGGAEGSWDSSDSGSSDSSGSGGDSGSSSCSSSSCSSGCGGGD